MASLIVISWRDIPAQVVVKRGRETAKVQLSARFQEAVDRAAMRAGKGSSDAYLADWKRSDPKPCGDDIHAIAAQVAAEIEARYSDEHLERMIRAKGLDPAASVTSEAGAASEATAGPATNPATNPAAVGTASPAAAPSAPNSSDTTTGN